MDLTGASMHKYHHDLMATEIEVYAGIAMSRNVVMSQVQKSMD